MYGWMENGIGQEAIIYTGMVIGPDPGDIVSGTRVNGTRGETDGIGEKAGGIN
jgi:hypothetical protein